jgi:hypothetical protein
MGVTKSDLGLSCGIHPTYSEEIIGLTQVIGEGELKASGC